MTDETIIQLTDEELAQADGGANVNGTTKYVEYTVVRGDNLTRIAHHFKTTIATIMALNPIIKNRNFIRTGWVLLVPDNR